jgi:hypothetical protein
MKPLTEMFSNYDRTGYGQPIPTNTTGATPSLGPAPARVNGPNILIGPMEVDHCASLYGWQLQLAGMLNNPAKDIYILSGAGSGKTAPVICHWVNKILEISTSQTPTNQNLLRLISEPQNIPQVLWLVPIKNLSANIEQEMIERFVSIILQILNRTCYIKPNVQGDPTSGNIIFANSVLDMGAIIVAMSQFGDNESRNLLRAIVVNNQVEKERIAEFKTVLGQLVLNYVKNALVGRIEEGINTVKINHTGQTKPFIISIYESSKNIVKDMNKLRLIVFDEAQRIQGGSDDDNRRAAQIGDSIHKILFDDNGRKAQIVMLSGSTSKATASNVMHYFNMTYKRRFDAEPYQTPTNVTNQSDIRVFPMNGLNDKFKQLQIIQTALAGGGLRKGGIVFIIFGKDKINQLIDQLAPTEHGYISPGKNLQTSTGSLYNTQHDVSQIVKPGDINDIDDDRLRRAASNGLGYLYRPEELTPARQHDTSIVQNLFRAGIIKVIFATDAVREGINITCNEMYIPTILLPPNRREMDAGSLAQLINRVGRKSGKYATIYTDPKFVGNITNALSTDSDRFGEQPFILPGSFGTKIEAGLNYGVNMPINAAKELGNAFINAFRKQP